MHFYDRNKTLDMIADEVNRKHRLYEQGERDGLPDAELAHEIGVLMLLAKAIVECK